MRHLKYMCGLFCTLLRLCRCRCRCRLRWQFQVVHLLCEMNIYFCRITTAATAATGNCLQQDWLEEKKYSPTSSKAHMQTRHKSAHTNADRPLFRVLYHVCNTLTDLFIFLYLFFLSLRRGHRFLKQPHLYALVVPPRCLCAARHWYACDVDETLLAHLHLCFVEYYE